MEGRGGEGREWGLRWGWGVECSGSSVKGVVVVGPWGGLRTGDSRDFRLGGGVGGGVKGQELSAGDIMQC